MAFLRGWKVFLSIIIGFLLLITNLPHKVLPQAFSTPQQLSSGRSSRCPIIPPSQPPTMQEINGFSWRTVKIKNPVHTLVRLPSDSAVEIPRVQSPSRMLSTEDRSTQNQRRKAVKRAFLRGWRSYYSRAFLHDELAPVSGGFKDTLGGWGATLVDSLDTLWIMDLRAEFEEAVRAASNISFAPYHSSSESINTFETTIRFLGGFLAAYDLTACKDTRLLLKAMEVGDMIYASFDTPNRMPITRWNIRKYDQQQYPAQNGIIAELASSSLEFTRLSQLTGDMRYYDAIARITDLLLRSQDSTRLPGMFPTAVGTRAEDFSQGTSFGFGAMADSAFEYFGKTWQLLLGNEPAYRRLYEKSLNMASSYLLYRPSTPDQADILISANYHTDTAHRDSQSQHLACFAGGMYLLGGRLFSNTSHIEIGKKLADGCAWAYKNSPLGVMPEIFEMKACPTFFPCPYDGNQKSPFTAIADARYILRPEAIESIFYAYRITGDSKYQDIAWEMFEAIDKHTKTEFGNAAIKDVMTQDFILEDSAESFWFGETLKYFYLIFSKPGLISLDDWVFNTEAHPFRIPRH